MVDKQIFQKFIWAESDGIVGCAIGHLESGICREFQIFKIFKEIGRFHLEFVLMPDLAVDEGGFSERGLIDRVDCVDLYWGVQF